MASKWLQERWEVFLPALAPLGCEQEEEIKGICEAELESWRRRPSLKKAISLQKPLTETRNRIRETFPLTQENGWYNPKSGEREHIALKYLNFSTEEWIQISVPSEGTLQERRAHPLVLARPWELLEKVEQLLESTTWPEMVVGLGLATGRGIVEILHTGHFTRKTAYSVWFAGPMTVYEVMCDPFEVPTLVSVEVVLEALARVRQFFGNHFVGQRRRDISQQCRAQIQEAAYKQLLTLVPLRPGERNVYKSLAHGVYPQLAFWFYCPSSVDKLLYLATIQQHRKLLEATSAEDRLTLGLASLYYEYVVLNEQGTVDDRQGIRLEETDVEVIAVFQQADVSRHQMSSGEEGSTRVPDVQETDRKYERRCADSELVTCEQEGAKSGMTIVQLDMRTLEEVNEVTETEKKQSIKRRQRSSVREQSLEDHLKKDVRHQKQMDRSAQPKALAMEWLGQRWKWFVVEMADFVMETDEEEMRVRCEEEMEAWRAYCEETKHMSFQEMVMRTRVALRTSIPAPQNEWWNPDAEEWEHIGLKYFQCSAAEWEQMRLAWLEDSMLLAHPEQIVARAIGMLSTGLMEAEAWPQLVVGIAVLTGQGLLRILKTGCFSQKTAFSLLFRDASHFNSFLRDPFEFPTLGRADLVVEAWECVRERVDCTQMDAQELLHRYGQLVGETATTFFHDLVQLPAEETDLFSMLTHCVYPCLATYYYCPPSLEIVEYLAQICHEPVLLADPSPGERFACAAVCNYLEYRLADERKGIWLDQIRKAELCTDHAMVEVEFDEEEIAELDDIRQQMGFDHVSTMMDRDSAEGNEDPEDVSGTLKLSITLQNQGLSPAMYEFLHRGLEHLMSGMAEFVSVCLREEMLTGLKLQQPFETMLSSELRACDHPQATYELARRSLVMVMRYNQGTSNPALRWYLNEDVIFQILQKSRSDIVWCLDTYREEIDRHHRRFHLTAAENEKPMLVTEVMHLAEEPYWFGEDGLCV